MSGSIKISLFSAPHGSSSLEEKPVLQRDGQFRMRTFINLNLSELEVDSLFQVVILLSIKKSHSVPEEEEFPKLVGFIRNVSVFNGTCASNGIYAFLRLFS